jgi:hypothetical protein
MPAATLDSSFKSIVMITSQSSIDSEYLSFANADAILVCEPTLETLGSTLCSRSKVPRRHVRDPGWNHMAFEGALGGLRECGWTVSTS